MADNLTCGISVVWAEGTERSRSLRIKVHAYCIKSLIGTSIPEKMNMSPTKNVATSHNSEFGMLLICIVLKCFNNI